VPAWPSAGRLWSQRARRVCLLKASSDSQGLLPIDLPRRRDRRFELAPLQQASVSSEVIDGGAVIVRLGGAVGVANVAEIATGILDELGHSGSDVTVDLRGVTLMDWRVVRAFILALRQAEERKHAVVLIRPHPRVWRAFERSGLVGAFPNCADPIEVRGLRGGWSAGEPMSSPARIGLRVVDGEGAERAVDAPSASSLTPRERRVLLEFARGRTTAAAAAAIGLSPHTVRSHLRSAASKLGAETRTQAVAIAIAQGAIQIGVPPDSRFGR
jgi:anti-anti-sigma factor